ncbi:MAG: GTPase ObgE [Armatimonadota bacterium]|nr:GTPase ObgE [Armatimonadota bacterium]
MVFVDEAEIDAIAGSGGNGLVAFRREKFVPRGGPSGGDGGHGGSVMVEVDSSLGTLADLRYKHHYRAERGGDGGPDNKKGKDAADLVIKVPPGTIVYDRATNELFADMVEFAQSVVVARGGVGGRGNASFATSTEQAPKFAEKGEPGESLELRLELKLLADVGIIGYPNVGKSTLISKVSAARPKIADYPFTTLIPNLGVVRVEEGRSFVMADIPGLIEGAHEGVGLGVQFLRHVERTKVLLHMLDVSGLTGRNPLDDYRKINDELRLFSEKLAALPRIIALNKMDAPGASETAEQVERQLSQEDLPLFRISALTGEGLQPLLYALADAVEKQKAEAAPLAEEVVRFTVSPQKETWSARKDSDHEYSVSGRDVERVVAMTDLGNEYALRRLHRRFERLGLNKELKKMGARDGDTVRIGAAEFEYKEEDVEE